MEIAPMESQPLQRLIQIQHELHNISGTIDVQIHEQNCAQYQFHIAHAPEGGSGI